jgi:integrase
MRRRLNDKFCASAKADKQTDWFDEIVPGMAFRVSPTAKTWTLHYTKPDGRRARLTLGRYPAISLTSARTKAREVKEGLAEGQQPQRTTDGSLRAIVDEYFRREGAKLRSVGERRAVFDRSILPALGDRPIDEIKRSEVVRLLDDLEDDRGPRAAGLAFAYLSKVMNWHASRDDDFRSPLVRGMARGQSKARERVLSDDEIRALWLGTASGDVFDRYLRFLLLTAVRRNEAGYMTRAELKGDLWTIPAARMKGKVEHVVPLSKAALAQLPATGERMFPGRRSHVVDFDGCKLVFDRAVPIEPGWRLHDLRRTARSLLSRAGVSPDIAERCLAHTIGGVRGVYDRHAYLDEKRAAFEALASLIDRIVDPQPNVVPIKGRP